MNRPWPHDPASLHTAPAGAPRGLYLITPDDDDTARLTARVAPLLCEGVVWLQYRNKTAAAALRHRQASALQALCAAAGVPLIVNDDLRLAKAVAAAGVHLGEDDGDIAAARALLGDGAIIGASCYDDLARAERAVAAGADYVAFGAFFPTRSKTGTRRASPGLLAAAAALDVPRVAIGGITPDNAVPLIAAGADLLAVIGGVFDAPDPVAAVRAYRACFM
jgi:thiamine-phosphate pyrophosphorylase